MRWSGKLLGKAIEKLSGRERMIIEMRFGLSTAGGEEMTQKEVADRMGISQSYISKTGEKDHETSQKRNVCDLNKKTGKTIYKLDKMW